MSFAFNPTDGYRNVTDFPTKPASETAFRDSMQDLLDQVRDYLNGGDLWGNGSTNTRSTVWAYRSGSQPISAGVWTTVIMDVESTDNLSEFNNSTGKFAPTGTGWYLFKARILCQSISAGVDVFTRASVNSGAGIYDLASVKSQGGDIVADGFVLVHLSGGDSIEIQINAGIATAVFPGAQFSRLEIMRLS